jgi:hypothetical protein
MTVRYPMVMDLKGIQPMALDSKRIRANLLVECFSDELTPSKLPHSSSAYDLESLRRENEALNQKLNYMMNSIKQFWSPELKLERQQRKEEALRLASFQEKVMQQAVRVIIEHLFNYPLS